MSAASKNNSKRIAALALAAAAGLTASRSAQAAPFMTARLLGSTSAGGPFTSSVNVTAGQTVFYQVQITLGAEGSTNTSATSPTITNWVPSNGATTPTAGLQSLFFSLTQSTGDSIQSNFSSGLAGTTTGGGTWGAGTGSSVGTPTARGNGNNNLLNVRLFRESGNFDGVAGTPVAVGEATGSEALETLTIAAGSFTIASGGTSGSVKLDLTGFTPTTIIAAYRWRTAANDQNVNYSQNANSQSVSTTAGDPIIVFQPLALVPEPATLGLLGVAGLGLLARRKRA